MSFNAWMPDEIATLRVTFERDGKTACYAALPNRSYSAIDEAIRAHVSRDIREKVRAREKSRAGAKRHRERSTEVKPASNTAKRSANEAGAQAKDLKAFLPAEKIVKPPCRRCGAGAFTLSVNGSETERECRDERACNARRVRGGVQAIVDSKQRLDVGPIMASPIRIG